MRRIVGGNDGGHGHDVDCIGCSTAVVNVCDGDDDAAVAHEVKLVLYRLCLLLSKTLWQ